MMWRVVCLRALAAVAFTAMLTVTAGPSVAIAQPDRAQAAYEQLTPEQRVGQLFLVAFYTPPEYYKGPDPDPLRDVRSLVDSYGLGGVVLQKGNNVFKNERGRDLPQEIADLNRSIQELALGDTGPGAPMFIAVDHEGDLDPLTHLREGFTAVPSAMAIGASYDESHSETVGSIVGAELEAVGVNMLLGPVLDVLADPRVDSGGDIGTRSFGGDPYWVRRMGSAYIRGVHEGSGGRVATVAKHFPGHGGSDRSTDDEVATVNKPLESLRDIELQPFAAVTSAVPGDPDAPGVTDALMTSHIRYRAIHPDVRRVTPPISFDQQGLGSLLGMEGFPFETWRDGGGLIVADSLGVRAVRRWFDPTEATFPNRQIARQALMAGNDVLILAQFAVQPSWSRMLANVEDTLEYFASSYRSDPTFRARVDEAAIRVMRRKAALYPSWSLEDVAPDSAKHAETVGSSESRESVARIGTAAVTSLRALDQPRGGDRIVVVSDYDANTNPTNLACPEESCGMTDEQWTFHQSNGPTLVESAILARYGPAGAGVVGTEDISTVTFCQLRELYHPRPATPTPESQDPPEPGEGPTGQEPSGCDPTVSPDSLNNELAQADWIVFAFAELSPTDVRDLRGLLLPQVNAFVQTGDHTRLAALSLGPPYYIDQTNFFHLDGYMAAYSKIPASIDAAVAALFGELEPTGALPVDYEDADLTLATLLSPDPGQRLSMSLVSPASVTDVTLPAMITVELGPVLDHAGHPVPDGTLFTIAAEPATALGQGQSPEARTVGAVARAEVPVVSGGRVTLRAYGENVVSEPLILELPDPTSTSVPRPTPTVEAVMTNGDPPGRPPIEPTNLLVALAAVGAGALLAFVAPTGSTRTSDRRLRTALVVAAMGLVGYVGLALLIRLSDSVAPERVALATVAVVAAGGVAGLLIDRARLKERDR